MEEELRSVEVLILELSDARGQDWRLEAGWKRQKASARHKRYLLQVLELEEVASGLEIELGDC